MTTVEKTPETVPTALMDAALGLPAEARRRLAELLLESVAGSAALSPEWKEEIARRLKADDDGLMPHYTLDEVAARLQRVVDEGAGR